MSNLQQVPYAELILSFNSLSSPSDPIRKIWGGMTGDIVIIHAGWNPEVAAQRISQQLYKEDTTLGISLHDIGVTEEQVRGVIVKIAKYPNMLIEGDMIANDHVLSILRFLYDPRCIRVKNSWKFGLTTDNVFQNKDFQEIVQTCNVVLICGPFGNLATSIFLDEANLSWLFDESETRIIRTNPDPKKGEKLECKRFSGSDKLRSDSGVFLRCKNPFNRDKRMYGLMGTHSYGTQGAAALACNNEASAELVSVAVDPDIISYDVDYIAWLKVWRNRIPKIGEFSDPKLRYQIVYPMPSKGAWKEHKNPLSIYETQTTLRSSLLENTLFLGVRPSILLLYTIGLSMVIFFSCALLWTNYRFPVVVAMLVLAIVGTIKMFLSLIMPPARRKSKVQKE